MKRFFSTIAVVASSALALAACSGGGGGGTTESGVELVKEGKLTLCSDIPYEPFEYVNDQNETVGFDIDLSKKLAERLGVELDVKTTPFEGIQSGSSLDTGQCDIALSGMGITDERKTKMDFSMMYLKDNLALMAAKDSGYKSIDDVKDKKVGAQAATTGEKYAKEKGISPTQFETGGLLTQAMQTRKIDAAIANVSTIYAATQADDSLTLVQDFETGEVVGAAVKKGNSKLLDEFNGMLEGMFEDGSYDKLVDEWFGPVADAARVDQEEAKASK
ncbi:transporter substrate-binding domain-containing protein [Brevibacterium sp. UMB1308A]|uniref:transporter substrate-binding domain-containing protein n=1 Tax=Brevibacterium sp. UMB1308A TaxID=3050608 RepID=UPI00254C4B97|nr:transporter substrate-binding domain-containing protein [Brevibacterium sp. UMB1308A]MDK8346305.1 transporter substrate-binding domain-containing protein [Brevibacterium sp. UMB1308B]MDK8712455.1 transporter substrate-binding domain-containing protein [Brevibacterium sp. UMB1308A]